MRRKSWLWLWLVVSLPVACSNGVPAEMPKSFVSIQVLDEGQCNPGFIYAILDTSQSMGFMIPSLHAHPVDCTGSPLTTDYFTLWGWHGKGCIIIHSFDKVADLKLHFHALHLLNGKEAHVVLDSTNMKIHSMQEIPECSRKIDEDDTEALKRCSMAMRAMVPSAVVALQEPMEFFDWGYYIVERKQEMQEPYPTCMYTE